MRVLGRVQRVPSSAFSCEFTLVFMRSNSSFIVLYCSLRSMFSSYSFHLGLSFASILRSESLRVLCGPESFAGRLSSPGFALAGWFALKVFLLAKSLLGNSSLKRGISSQFVSRIMPFNMIRVVSYEGGLFLALHCLLSIRETGLTT